MLKKVCTRCKKELSIEEYYNRKTNKKDGKFSECKTCHKERYIKWLNSDKGKAYTKEKNKERYEEQKNDPEFLEKRRAKDRKYYEKNREKKLASVKLYQAKKSHEKKLLALINENPTEMLAILKIASSLVDILDDKSQAKQVDLLLEQLATFKKKSPHENKEN